MVSAWEGRRAPTVESVQALGSGSHSVAIIRKGACTGEDILQIELQVDSTVSLRWRVCGALSGREVKLVFLTRWSAKRRMGGF